ncbi:polysaccharide deacetylase [Lucifera butyrica]|uniref:Polysaccharide deacetylase n=1 Tax=Lucifera butyrica TaxID=1351585 RepID=A0A498R9K7_9FIRM|nr:polysaccharide deacetylase [Lucifera butyrica]
MAIAGTLTDDRVVALTFDYDQGEGAAPQILAILKEGNAKATFFMNGNSVRDNPELVHRMMAEGHEIGNQGYSQQDYRRLTAAQIEGEIRSCNTVFEKMTGLKSSLVRFPLGHFNRDSLEAVNKLGFTAIIWNIDSKDTTITSADRIVEQIAGHIKPGSIILLHCSDRIAGTVQALPAILKLIGDAGYQTVTVGQLLQQHSQKGVVRY